MRLFIIVNEVEMMGSLAVIKNYPREELQEVLEEVKRYIERMGGKVRKIEKFDDPWTPYRVYYTVPDFIKESVCAIDIHIKAHNVGGLPPVYYCDEIQIIDEGRLVKTIPL